MKVGDIVTETPTFYSNAGLDVVGPQKCRVTYIHPKRRFYTVEFKSYVTGETWRECRYFPDRAGNPRAPMAIREPEGRHTAPRRSMQKEALYGH